MVFRCVLCMARLPRCSAPLVFPLAMFPLPKIDDASSRAEGMRSSREPFQGFLGAPPLGAQTVCWQETSRASSPSECVEHASCAPSIRVFGFDRRPCGGRVRPGAVNGLGFMRGPARVCASGRSAFWMRRERSLTPAYWKSGRTASMWSSELCAIWNGFGREWR